MSTITKEFTKEQLIERADHLLCVGKAFIADHPGYDGMAKDVELFKIALASLEAEPVAYVSQSNLDALKRGHNDVFVKRTDDVARPVPLYTAPPAPVSVPTFDEWCEHTEQKPVGWVRDAMKEAYDGCRAAMLQGAETELQHKAAIHDALCEKYNVESLADFVEWQRNHIAELEAAPPAPVGPDETAVMPDYPGYVMTQRECYQAGKKAGMAEVGSAPVAHDGWVACSERMPETDGNYWGWWSESKRQGPVWFIKSELQAQFQSSEITHWMPLPAAPQQEVKP